MTVAAIVKTLAKEFSIEEKHAQCVLDLLGAGLKPPYLAHYRKAEIGQLAEGALRRFDRRRKEFEELERRRESLLSSADHASASTPEATTTSETTPAETPASTEDAPAEAPKEAADQAPPTVDPALRKSAESCLERCELEDLFLPSRRPEPEVQLAMDRGLGILADQLIAAAPKGAKAEEAPAETAPSENGAEAKPEEAPAEAQPEEAKAEEAKPEEADAAPEAPTADEAPTEEAKPDEAPPAETAEASPAEEAKTDEKKPDDATPEATKPEEAQPEEAQADDAKPAEAKPEEQKGGKGKKAPDANPKLGAAKVTPIEFGPALARACATFVNPDRDVHSEAEALEGAMRILSDRLGRDPKARRLVRRLARKHGRLTVRALVDERKLGRNRSLLRLNVPIKQIQGHRLLALRQAQLHRQVTTSVSLDESLVLPRLKATLARKYDPEFESVLTAVTERAFRRRLLPSIEEDLRNELRRRAEEEAIRFLAQHLRQILLAPCAGRRPVAGLHVDARGDWTIVVLDERGQPTSGEIKLEASSKEGGELADDLGNSLRDSSARAIAVGNGKGARQAVRKLREAIHILQADAHVFIVNEAGVSTYANSDAARRELADISVPARQAIALGRRHQDPMTELLKVDPRHLGLGKEQSVISKANLRRVLHDTVESCVAIVGCDINSAPLHVLRHVPGLDFDIAQKLIKRREDRPFYSREELRTDGILDELRWTNAIGFLRVHDSSEPLDRTSLHPDQYAVARSVIERTGGTPDEVLGRRDAMKGMRRVDFDLDEGTWRDFVREISHPGRDPRARVFIPRLLPPDLDPKTLEKGQVVEGIVSSVASFGAFVDLGIPQDGMLHISEISSRYVRDARGLLSIGQIVRVKVLDAGGQRVELSRKGVPDRRRAQKGQGGGRPRRQQGRDRDRDAPKEGWPEYQPTVRAARTRRDGLAGASTGREGRGGRGPGRGGPGRGGGGRGRGGPGRRGPGGRRGREEGYDAAAVRKAASDKTSYNPFAKFFKENKGDEPSPEKPEAPSEPPTDSAPEAEKNEG